ncbi:hypothetical protein C8R48DRAFT_267357 [Suillus tomentosus]|nr:hypothetical protein C8R48DRAFT_267357 [Suillus tomentosus]
MDNLTGISAPDLTTLSYNETVSYECQVFTHASNDSERAPFNYVGSIKLYLLSDTTQARMPRHAQFHLAESDSDIGICPYLNLKHKLTEDNDDNVDIEEGEDERLAFICYTTHSLPTHRRL